MKGSALRWLFLLWCTHRWRSIRLDLRWRCPRYDAGWLAELHKGEGMSARLFTMKNLASELGVPVNTARSWVKRGIIPGPMPGTRYWDIKAVHLALDKLSGLEPEKEEDALEKWIRENPGKV